MGGGTDVGGWTGLAVALEAAYVVACEEYAGDGAASSVGGGSEGGGGGGGVGGGGGEREGEGEGQEGEREERVPRCEGWSGHGLCWL